MKTSFMGGVFLVIIIFLSFLEPFCVQSSDGSGIIFDSILGPQEDNSTCSELNGFGCFCKSALECNISKHLECIDYKCFCMYPMHRTYDNKLKRCVNLIGSVCDSGVGLLPRCIRNSVCEEGRCVCQEGYTPTSKFRCMIGFGEPCGPFQCNVEAGLGCKSGICECLDSSYIYSALTRTCFDPETFVKKFLSTWFDRTFIRDVIIRKFFKLCRRIIGVIKKPFRIFRLFG